MRASPVIDDAAARRLPFIALAVLVLATAGYEIATTGGLPATVATHFAGDGRPNGWMTRDGYRIFIVAFTIALPLFVTVSIGWLPRRFPRFTNIPNRDHWFAPERRAAAFAFLAGHGALLGSLLVLFAGGIHALILNAHTRQPPRLDHGLLAWMMAAFLVGLTLWSIALFRRFPKPRIPA